jgi:cell pole-organizing protein PopZ
MEDILASIKRIIAEDSEAVGARPARLRREAINAVQASPVVMEASGTDGAEATASDPQAAVESLPEDRSEAMVETHPAELQDWSPEARSDDEQIEQSLAEQARIDQEDAAKGQAEPDTAATPTEKPARAPEDVLELTSTISDAKSEAQENDEMPATKPSVTVSSSPATGVTGLVSGQAATASRNAFAALTQLQVRDEEGKANTLEGLVSDLLRPMLREWLDSELPPLVERVVTAEVRRLSGGAL